MKKNLLSILALATSLVACTDDYTDWADPQYNDQEEAKNVSFTATPVPAIDLADVTTDSITVFSPSVTAEEGAKVSYKLVIEGKHVLIANNQGMVAAKDLSNALVDLYGKRPTERVMSSTVEAYINIHGQSIKKNSSIEVKAIPTAPVIENAYYFAGTNNNWNVQDETYKFNHSGKDVYDDPEFTLIIPAPYKEDGTRDDMWFKIAPQSAFDSGEWNTVLGCATNGDEALSGNLMGKVDDTEPGSIKMPAGDNAKFYQITLNMMDYTYTIVALSFEEFIYVPGNHQGWAPATAPALQSASFDGIYTGYSYLNGEFKFTKGHSWEDGEYNSSHFTTVTGGFVLGEGGGNINMPEAGFYQIKANIAKGELSAVPVQWGIIGDATPGQWDADQDMVWDSEKKCWTATIILTDGTIKFRANDGWDINLGGATDNLVEGGDNIAVTAGTYDICLYAERTDSDKIYCTLTKK
ncbi:DUF5115 domain-containing protein [Phocaeicola sp.]|uniref:Outer membrane protein SusF domain-containing protein n=1 Tax=Phocaeicola sp. TaxID=2773926 RepID=UPI0023CC6572|nr:DUF5115 domain-containing protein [Phocaeicola sp.]MDE5678268.1 DUF5115 domain-containing protein [Phocaeicola sp.]